MTDPRNADAALEQAYSDGGLAGFIGLDAVSDCPFDDGKAAYRMAWLDGFEHGVWRRAAKANRTETPSTGVGLSTPGPAIANTAIAHLLRISKIVQDHEARDDDLQAALTAASMFVRLAGLTVPEVSDRPVPDFGPTPSSAVSQASGAAPR